MPGLRRPSWFRQLRPRWLIAGIVSAFVAFALVLFFVVPPLMTSGEAFGNSAERLKAESEIRTAALQLLAGTVLAVGAVFAGITLVFIGRARSQTG